MKLSEAISKRERLLATAEKMEQWHIDQKHNNGANWFKMNRAIEKVIDDAYHEYQELNEKIEAVIQDMEID